MAPFFFAWLVHESLNQIGRLLREHEKRKSERHHA